MIRAPMNLQSHRMLSSLSMFFLTFSHIPKPPRVNLFLVRLTWANPLSPLQPPSTLPMTHHQRTNPYLPYMWVSLTRYPCPRPLQKPMCPPLPSGPLPMAQHLLLLVQLTQLFGLPFLILQHLGRCSPSHPQALYQPDIPLNLRMLQPTERVFHINFDEVIRSKDSWQS